MPLLPNDLANLDAEALNDIADKKGLEFVHGKIRTNQIRTFFGAVSNLRQRYRNEGGVDEELLRALILLKPKLAYAAGRQDVVRPFRDFMDAAINAVSNSTNKDLAARNFFSLVESVVAYHKFHGGKDN